MYRRLLSLLLVAVLLLGLWVPVSAAEQQETSEASEYLTEDYEEPEHDINDDECWEENPEDFPEAFDSVAAETTAATAAAITTTGTAAGTQISASVDGSTYWLLLPATADPAAIPLSVAGADSLSVTGSLSSVTITNGGSINLNTLCGAAPSSGIYSLTVKTSSKSYTLKLRFSENVAAMYLTSDDPVNKGRKWVEASSTKSNQATGSMVLQNPDGSVVYSNTLTQIKGRGNTTWNGAKRPYQIKLGTKTDLLETGNKANKNKTWVLLANYYDATLLHNALTDDLAKAMGMECPIEYRMIDLYYDGVYRGSYMLCEKVAINSGRIEINDLEGDNEKANPNISDFSALSRATAYTKNGACYRYYKGITNPTDITGGYLLEIDFSSRAAAEPCFFKTKRGYYITVKSPEYCSKEEMDYIASLYQDFENAAYNKGVNASTGKKLSDYMDLDSAAQCCLINELSKNPDSFASSAYIYKDAGSDVLKMGPVWDYDLAYGLGNYSYSYETKIYTGWFASSRGLITALRGCSDFVAAVYRNWVDKMEPLVGDVLLGDENAVSADGALHSLKWYEAQTAESAANNYTWWSVVAYNGSYHAGRTYSANISYMNSWITNRYNWICKNIDARFYTDLCGMGQHNWVLNEAACVDLSCTVDGKTVYNCTRCSKKKVDTTPAVGHIPDKSTVETQQEPTACSDGYSTYTCSVCHTAGLKQTLPRIFLDTCYPSFYADAVESFYAREIVRGVSATAFGTNEDINRGMLVTLLHRMVGCPAYTEVATFTDVPADGYYAAAVYWAAENGIVNGYNPETFAPMTAISRQDLAVILYRYAVSLRVNVATTVNLENYEDAASVADYAEEAMRWAVESGIIKGVSVKELAPRATATRAQGVTMLYRFEQYLATAERIAEPEPEPAPEPDPEQETQEQKPEQEEQEQKPEQEQQEQKPEQEQQEQKPEQEQKQPETESVQTPEV